MMPNPFNQMKKVILFLMLLSVLIISAFNSARAHDNSSSLDYYYPSATIYGFVQECWKTMEGTNHPMTVNLWPAEVQTLCGCILDNIRMSVPWNAFRDSWKGPLDTIQHSMVEDYSKSCMKDILEMKGKTQ